MTSEETPGADVVPTTLESARSQAEAALEPDRPAKLTRTLTFILEDLVPVPGTKIRLGIDPVLSLIPWAGTATGAVFGSAVMIDAIRLRTPVPVLVRMLGNWAIDWLLGVIPGVGTLLDFAWRSNSKNLKLLNRTIDDRAQVRDASIAYWISAAAILFSMLALAVLLPIALFVWLLTRA
ncbi:DUF4112 domain-containing protein [Tessaracoccus sp. HDW20]|uniref:DUF4112 domain-containing protein n=1 Tax=Tessaracoccus coleopterorum TaxID=2714950 RepID=UPI0018D46305|nr:DUF4112 domain-containing protein [Tessaracoccus coleopterorum]NHB84112.1 DUF4112 domain-containing protein [Tessaracoccus coleopterorum]